MKYKIHYKQKLSLTPKKYIQIITKHHQYPFTYEYSQYGHHIKTTYE